MPLSPDQDARRESWASWIRCQLRMLTPPCREATRLISEGMERPLPMRLRIGLVLHRHTCVPCARFAEQVRLVQEASRQIPEQMERVGRSGLNARAKERIKRTLRGGSGRAF